MKRKAIMLTLLLLLPATWSWAGGFRYDRGSSLRNSGYFSYDDSGFTYRMRSDYSPAGEREYTIANLKAPIDLKADCSGLDFDTNIRSILNLDRIKDHLKDILVSTIYNFLLTLAYSEPTIAAILTNTQALGSMRLSVLAGQCTAQKVIEQANLKYNVFLSDFERCVLQKKSEGKPDYVARRECYDRGASWDKDRSLLDIVFEGIEAPPEMQEKIQKIRDILPDVIFSAEGSVGRRPPRYTIRQIYENERDRYEEELRDIVIQVRNGEPVDEDDIKTLASGRTVLTPQAIYSLAALPDLQAAFAGAKIADALAAASLIDRVAETVETIRVAMQSNPNMENPQIEEMERNLRNLKEQVDNALWAKRAEDELVVAPIMQVLAERNYQATVAAATSNAAQESALTASSVARSIDYWK